MNKGRGGANWGGSMSYLGHAKKGCDWAKTQTHKRARTHTHTQGYKKERKPNWTKVKVGFNAKLKQTKTGENSGQAIIHCQEIFTCCDWSPLETTWGTGAMGLSARSHTRPEYSHARFHGESCKAPEAVSTPTTGSLHNYCTSKDKQLSSDNNTCYKQSPGAPLNTRGSWVLVTVHHTPRCMQSL